MNNIGIKSITDLVGFVKKENVLGFKLGDELNNVKAFFSELEFNVISNKYFYLLSYKNVEFTFVDDLLDAIQVEVGKPSGVCIDIADFSYGDVLKEFISNKIVVKSKIEGELIFLEPNVKLVFNNNYLVEIYFLES